MNKSIIVYGKTFPIKESLKKMGFTFAKADSMGEARWVKEPVSESAISDMRIFLDRQDGITVKVEDF